MTLGRIKAIHTKVLRDKPTFFGSPTRRMFCSQESRKLTNYPFKKLFVSLMKAVEDIRHEMNSYYESFFCVLCDGKNQKFMDVK